ncbi:MAG: HAMP domain-containing histidine kinase [Candidatus Cloacimonetes bacterium]|nr:HAMP domain-containing histidine kinase [Candidatus Cloacimonadota bacterium]
MRFRLGFKTLVILTYIALFTAGLVLLYQYQESRRQNLEDEISSLHLQEFMSSLVSSHEEYTKDARELLQSLNEIKATIEIGNRQTAVYSGFYLVLMLVVSLTLFLWAIYSLTSPLKKMSRAAREIGKGNFEINLKESGTWELREALHSFNLMSKQLQATQKKLLEAEKLSIWKQFSRMLAHEIKNPLTPMRLSLERLHEKEGSPDFERIYTKCMRIINEEVDNLQNLATNFSRFAKEEPVSQKSFMIKTKLAQILYSYEDRVRINYQGDDFEIKFDELHFYQIITNIIQNALDAAGSEKPLQLILTKSNNSLCIRDEGIGIEPEDLEKIFEPYFTKKKKGIGLGLALVKKLVTVNDAEIRVESKENKGTDFIIKFAAVN